MLAITALELLRTRGFEISDENIRDGLERVRWSGRFEILRRNPTVVLDGAHNPHGAHAAAESLRLLFPGQKLVFVVGVMADKDVAGLMGEFVPLAERFICVKPRNPRAMEASRLAELLSELGAVSEAAESVESGVARAVEYAGADGAIIALGSLYFSADIRAAVENT
jgi:dihydrofolate synthase/folylpolyglutamate synthase